MLEFPEVMTISSQLAAEAVGRKVTAVLPPSKEHKFCWFNGSPDHYEAQIRERRITEVRGFGLFVEIVFDNGMYLCFNDGVNVRLIPSEGTVPKSYQLLIRLEGGDVLAFTVAMYGGIILHGGDYDNEYYRKSQGAVSPLSEEFSAYYWKVLKESRPGLSIKAFLATEQRFPGIGNGVLQDILFHAGIHPKRKLGTLDEEEKGRLEKAAVGVLRQMAEAGGRDTEKNIYGQNGGYRTVMSKNGLSAGCPACGGKIVKETYMGGTVYYCPVCQPLSAEGTNKA